MKFYNQNFLTFVCVCITYDRSTTVPVNLILQDGSVLQLNAAVSNGEIDMETLQNLGLNFLYIKMTFTLLNPREYLCFSGCSTQRRAADET